MLGGRAVQLRDSRVSARRHELACAALPVSSRTASPCARRAVSIQLLVLLPLLLPPGAFLILVRAGAGAGRAPARRPRPFVGRGGRRSRR